MDNRHKELIDWFRGAVNSELEYQAMTRADLARRMNVTPGRVTQILSDKEDLSVKTMLRVLAALGLSMSLKVSPHCRVEKNDGPR